MITLSGSNYPCLERICMVPKLFEPLRFNCISEKLQRVQSMRPTFVCYATIQNAIYCTVSIVTYLGRFWPFHATYPMRCLLSSNTKFRGLKILDRFPPCFARGCGGGFCDPFAFLTRHLIWKGVTLKGKNMLPGVYSKRKEFAPLGANSFLLGKTPFKGEGSRFFPFRVPLLKGRGAFFSS